MSRIVFKGLNAFILRRYFPKLKKPPHYAEKAVDRNPQPHNFHYRKNYHSS